MKKLIGKLIGVAFLGYIGYSFYTFVAGSGPNIEDITSKYVEQSPYVVELEIKQEHLSLSLSKHAKDSINAFEFKLPVSKEYYDSVNKKDVIVDDFRTGSLVTEGSVGSWKVKVEDKEMNEKASKGTDLIDGKEITVGIEQNHLSFNPFKHAKDSMNKIEFEMDVNNEFYENIEEGDVLIKEFRWGSLFSEGSVGNWELTVVDK